MSTLNEKLSNPQTFQKLMSALDIPTEARQGIDFQLFTSFDGENWGEDIEERWGNPNTNNFYTNKTIQTSKVFQALSPKLKDLAKKGGQSEIEIMGTANSEGISLHGISFNKLEIKTDRTIKRKLTEMGHFDSDYHKDKLEQKKARRIHKQAEKEFNQKLKEEKKKTKNELKKIKQAIRKTIYDT